VQFNRADVIKAKAQPPRREEDIGPIRPGDLLFVLLAPLASWRLGGCVLTVHIKHFSKVNRDLILNLVHVNFVAQ
jgi:hypothetical protein